MNILLKLAYLFFIGSVIGFSTVASEEVFPLNPARKLWIVFEKEER